MYQFAHKCLFKKAGESRALRGVAFHALQLLPDSSVASRYASDGSGHQRSRLELGGVNFIIVMHIAPPIKRGESKFCVASALKT